MGEIFVVLRLPIITRTTSTLTKTVIKNYQNVCSRYMPAGSPRIPEIMIIIAIISLALHRSFNFI
jgi:hypothetical protein